VVDDMKSLIMKNPALFAFLILVALWQGLGAAVYMVVLANHPAAPFFFGAVKAIMFILPLVGVWLGISTGRIFSGWNKQDLFIGLGFGTVLFVGLLGIFYLFPEIFAEASKEALPRAVAFGIGTPTTFVIAGVLFAVVHSLFEEYYWRWFVFGGLRSFMSIPSAIILSALTFSIHHVFILLPFVSVSLAIFGGLVVGAVGGIWSFMYTKQHNLIAAWISHIMADLALVYIIYQILFA
jgi:hypothetical protein